MSYQIKSFGLIIFFQKLKKTYDLVFFPVLMTLQFFFINSKKTLSITFRLLTFMWKVAMWWRENKFSEVCAIFKNILGNVRNETSREKTKKKTSKRFQNVPHKNKLFNCLRKNSLKSWKYFILFSSFGFDFPVGPAAMLVEHCPALHFERRMRAIASMYIGLTLSMYLSHSLELFMLTNVAMTNV